MSKPPTDLELLQAWEDGYQQGYDDGCEDTTAANNDE